MARYSGARRGYTRRRSTKRWTSARRKTSRGPPKVQVVTTQREATSSNRVGYRGLSRISTGRFRNLPTLWPDRMMMKMKYVDTVNSFVTFSTGTYYNPITYRSNSLYDPLTTTAAEQPIAGFNEMAQMYNSYRVHACNVKVNITSTSGNYPFLVVLSHLTTNSGPTSYLQALESIGNPYTVWSQCQLAIGNGSVDLDNYVKLSKLVGTDSVNTDNDYAATVNANPVKTTYISLFMGCAQSPSTGFTAYLVVQIEFYCEFFQRSTEFN